MSGYGQYPPAWGGGYPAPSYPPQQGYSRPYEQTPPYYAPPPHHHYQPRHEEQPDIAVDPNAFRRFYMYHLSTLVHNSKPIITNLTLLAQDHIIRMAPVVAQCLDDHLRTCDPFTSLPAFYLLDSISKNIGPPYTTLFARFIERAFLSAYRAVDGPTKIKLEELLGTWRTGANDGGELFRLPEEGRNGRVQYGIESALFGNNGRGGGIGGRAMNDAAEYMAGVQQTPSIATQNERSAVLFDVRRLLQLRLDQVPLRPDDAINNTQIVALQQLESLVLDTQLSADQVHQIRGQLSALAPLPEVKEEERRRASSANLMELAASLEPISSPYPPSFPTPSVADDTKPILPPTASSGLPAAALQNIDPALLAQLQGLAGSIPGLSDLFAAATARTSTPIPNVKLEDSVDRLVEEYDDALRSLNIKLSNTDIARFRPEAISFLYDRFQLQCKQCGLRYFDSATGQKHMDVHLDWHFTHKRRIREGAARAQGRSWFSLEEDWIRSDDIDTSFDVDPSTASSSKPDTTAIDRAELKKSKVIAPTDPAKISKPCPICKERFQSEFSEEDEEWMFFNAVEVDGVIYHATCRAEAAAARIASRLKLGGTDSNRPSRESTPISTTAKGKARAEEIEQGSAKKRKVESEVEEVVSQSIAEEEERVKRIKLEDDEEVVEY